LQKKSADHEIHLGSRRNDQGTVQITIDEQAMELFHHRESSFVLQRPKERYGFIKRNLLLLFVRGPAFHRYFYKDRFIRGID